MRVCTAGAYRNCSLQGLSVPYQVLGTHIFSPHYSCDKRHLGSESVKADNHAGEPRQAQAG